MSKYLSVAVLVIGLSFVMLLTLFIGDVGTYSSLKNLLGVKNNVNVVYDVAEEKLLKGLEDKLTNWQDLLVLAYNDVGELKTDMDGAYIDTPYLQEIKQAKADYLGQNVEHIGIDKQDDLIYKLSRRLNVYNESELEKYESMLLTDKQNAVFPKYYIIEDKNVSFNTWGLAQEIVNWSGLYGDLGEINKTTTVKGEYAKDYGHDYFLDDKLVPTNLIKEKGLVSVSGDYDSNKNVYTMTAANLYGGKLSYFEYTLIEDKYEKDVNSEIDVSDVNWDDKALTITTIFNETTNMLETYIGMYSLIEEKMNLYQYSFVEDKINLVSENIDLKIGKDNKKLTVSELLDDTNVKTGSISIKDVKLRGTFDKSTNVPYLMIGVDSELIYSEEQMLGVETLKSNEAVWYYDYFPLISENPEISKLRYVNKKKDWDFDMFWSNNYSLSVINQVTLENTGLEFNSAMALIENDFTHSKYENILKITQATKSNFKGGDGSGEIELDDKMLTDISYTAFVDESSGLVKNILVGKYNGVLIELMGNYILEDWDEVHEIAEATAGDIEISSSRGDINRIQMVEKPEVLTSIESELKIHIKVEDFKRDVRAEGESKYKFKIGADEVSYDILDRNRR